METCPNCGYTDEGNEYVEDFFGADGKHIIAKGRQVGGTTMIVNNAIEDAKKGKRVAIVAPKQNQVFELVDRFTKRESWERNYRTRLLHKSGGKVRFFSSSKNIEFDHSNITPDSIYVDEAQEVKQKTILGIENIGQQTLVFVYTPHEQSTLLNGYMQYNPTYETWHIPTSAANHICDEKIEQQYDYLLRRHFYREIEARYWNDTRDIIPDHDYSQS